MDLALLEAAARARIDLSAYDYYAGGAHDELTLADNEAAWRRLRLCPRVLRGIERVSTATTVLGTEVRSPVLVAPTAMQRMAHDEGECATARGAAAAGTVFVLSTSATIGIAEVAAAAPAAPKWFQLYMHRDRRWSGELVRRAVDAGYRALVLTVDIPGVLGRRLRDVRNNFSLPPHLEMANTWQPERQAEGSDLEEHAADKFDPTLSFRDISWLAEISGLPVVVKGVLRPDDALRCVEAGASAIAVSNHGGRQLDTAVATADALPGIVEAVAGAVEVYVDGGIRRGTDVVKALALGARAVMLGRPVLWGLATGGAEGVTAVLEHFADETGHAMALCGAARPADVDPSLLWRGGR